MYDVTAILPENQGIGFTLAGVKVIEVANREDAVEMLISEFDKESNGIILIDENYTEELPNWLQRKIDESSVPLVVSIPVITQWEYAHDRSDKIEDIIRRSVGYRIKLS